MTKLQRTKRVFSTKGAKTCKRVKGVHGCACTKLNLHLDLPPSQRVNSKWIIYLNIKCNIIKFLKETIGETLCDLRFGNEFLDTTPKA